MLKALFFVSVAGCGAYAPQPKPKNWQPAKKFAGAALATAAALGTAWPTGAAMDICSVAPGSEMCASVEVSV